MLRRLLGNLIPTLDNLIERIPPHIRDIIQKASLAFAALIALLVIISGINKGLRDAKPAGYKLVERNRDLFYLQEMREEYARKRKLVEDVDVDPMQFPSRQAQADDTKYVTMGRDTMGHLMGEKDEMLKHEDTMRPREKSPGYLGDSYTVPRLTPDAKTIDDGEAHLQKEQIGSRREKEPVGAAEKPAAAAPVAPARSAAPARDIFDEPSQKKPAAASAVAPAPAKAQPARKMEFMD